MIDDYLPEWNVRRSERATEATDRYLGRHPDWGESCDQILSITIEPGWKRDREKRAAEMKNDESGVHGRQSA